MKERKKSNKKKVPLVLLATIIAVGIIGGIGYSEYSYEAPFLVEILYPSFEGTKEWKSPDEIVWHRFDNGTLKKMTVLESVNMMEITNYQEKTINLDDGTIDYYFRHSTGMSTKASG